jgi:hypothetical protein
MGLTRQLNAITQATRAAHAAWRVYGSEPEPEPYRMQPHLDARRLWRTRRIVRIPAADSLPNTYECPACLTDFETGLSNRVNRMLRGAVDAGNGNVFDQAIDHLAAEASFELKVEHSLRASTAQLLVMRNRGDAAKIPAQLADVDARLAQADQMLAELREDEQLRNHRPAPPAPAAPTMPPAPAATAASPTSSAPPAPAATAASPASAAPPMPKRASRREQTHRKKTKPGGIDHG